MGHELKTLRQVRAAKLLSQERLAELAGLTRVTVLRIETGTVVPTYKSITALSAALRVEPHEVLEFHDAIARRSEPWAA